MGTGTHTKALCFLLPSKRNSLVLWLTKTSLKQLIFLNTDFKDMLVRVLSKTDHMDITIYTHMCNTCT